MTLESKFQAELVKELKRMLPGCIVLKNDANYLQGIPDLLVLFENKWAALECKKSEYEARRPNQTFYVDKMDAMSFAAFIYPESKKEILDELYAAFGVGR